MEGLGSQDREKAAFDRAQKRHAYSMPPFRMVLER